MHFKQALVEDQKGRRYGWFPTKGLKVGAVLHGLKVLEVYHGIRQVECKDCGKLIGEDVTRCQCQMKEPPPPKETKTLTA
jgi:hypothetical protein